MTWFRVDDGWRNHPKVSALSMAARGLWVTCGGYCVEQRTYGHISTRQVRREGGTAAQIAALVECDLWRWCADHAGCLVFVNWRKTQDGDYRRNIRRAVRASVLERDGHRCVACGATDNLSLDHIVRYRDGGSDDADNLRVMCMPCNLERG